MKMLLTLILSFTAVLSCGATPPPSASPAKDPGADEYAEFVRLIKETGGNLDDRHLAALRKAATQGHPMSQGTLGIYLTTESGKTDPAAFNEGVSWLKKVENMDKPEFDSAVFALSLCYLCGTGTQQDMERGGALLARTAVRGNSDMKMAYAEFLQGIKKDLAGARAIWSEVAKDASNPEAQQEAKELLRDLK